MSWYHGVAVSMPCGQVSMSQSGKDHQDRHVERQRNISLIKVFSSRRSFAYAQDDDTEMCGTVKAERAGRFVFRLSSLVFCVR